MASKGWSGCCERIRFTAETVMILALIDRVFDHSHVAAAFIVEMFGGECGSRVVSSYVVWPASGERE